MEEDIKHRIYGDEELGIARAIDAGPADETAARWMLWKTEKIAAEHGDEVDWLLDLSGITTTTARGRKILAQVSGHPSIRKYPMVGATTFLCTVANFINTAAGNSGARHFTTEEEALS